ncbi:MAG: toxin [Treponema sp.]|nr:toxin [Treponema sp.]
MKFVWQEEKNKLLKQERNISFEQIVLAIENKQVVDVLEHPNQEKYKGQKCILVESNNYVYVVPATILDSGEECHLKTIYPSRKYTQKYRGGKK